MYWCRRGCDYFSKVRLLLVCFNLTVVTVVSHELLWLRLYHMNFCGCGRIIWIIVVGVVIYELLWLRFYYMNYCGCGSIIWITVVAVVLYELLWLQLYDLMYSDCGCVIWFNCVCGWVIRVTVVEWFDELWKFSRLQNVDIYCN